MKSILHRLRPLMTALEFLPKYCWLKDVPSLLDFKDLDQVQQD